MGTTTTTDKQKYQEIIDGIISAESGSDLKKLLDKTNNHNWKNSKSGIGRMSFLLGLLQGSLMQFNKEESVKELKEIFINL